MDKKTITKSSSETMVLGSTFAKELKAGDVVMLFGDLGSGKTTFAQGIAQGLEIADRIISPTFVLIRSHNVNVGHTKNLNHIDLYRIEKPSELANLGLTEVLERSDSINVIEWADRLAGFEPKNGYKIYFKHLNGNKREITIKDHE